VIFEVGAPVDLTFDPDKAHLFAEDPSVVSSVRH
jgi:hypothetical protein